MFLDPGLLTPGMGFEALRCSGGSAFCFDCESSGTLSVRASFATSNASWLTESMMLSTQYTNLILVKPVYKRYASSASVWTRASCVWLALKIIEAVMEGFFKVTYKNAVFEMRSCSSLSISSDLR